MKGLIWFRRDLRLHDNPALSAACKECREIVPLFVFDEPLLQSHVFGSACVGFMLGCLEELRRSLEGRGLTLAWRIGDRACGRTWRVQTRAGRGNAKRGLALLDKLDRAEK